MPDAVLEYFGSRLFVTPYDPSIVYCEPRQTDNRSSYEGLMAQDLDIEVLSLVDTLYDERSPV